VVTNSKNGYSLTIRADEVNLVSTTDETAMFVPQSVNDGALDVNAWGYGVGATSPENWRGVTTGDVEIDNYGAATMASGRDTLVWLGARAGYTLPAGEYVGTVTLTAVVK
jgi:hypothetical protein